MYAFFPFTNYPERIGKMVSEEFKELWNANVGWGKLFAPNEAGIQAFLKFYGAYVHHKT